MPLCTAHKKRTGEPCGRWALSGANVCIVHGAAAPQVRAKAQQRLLMAADSAAATLVEIYKDRKGPKPARVSAAMAVLDRAGFSVRQIMEHSGPEGGPIELALVQRLQAARQRALEHNKAPDLLPALPAPEKP